MKIARIFLEYKGPSSYYLFKRIHALDKTKFQTICISYSDLVDNGHIDATLPIKTIPRGSLFKTIYRLKELLDSEKVDIVHCNRLKELQLVSYACLLTKRKVKVISHIHGRNRCRGFRRKLFFKLFSKRIDALIGCSDNVKEDIIKNYPKMSQKALSIPNSIDYDKYRNFPANPKMRSEIGVGESDFIFFLAARLVETKGHDLLIKAFAMLCAEKTDIKLVLAGDGRLKEKLQKLCADLDIQNKVIFLGNRSDVPQLLKMSNAFTLSSINEGMPLCVFEAMAAGIPVIATGTGGHKEVLADSEYGYYVDRNVDAFYQAMKTVYELSEADYRELVNKADKRVKNVYSHENAVKELTKIYNQII